ncbi:hypothetical protein QVD17_36437 [Tagetes erecta]|uniref:C2H2-type domain-containing protein n=1 Tax=Tagetes erecta TaxID=13708 RepID=A0AAD8NJ81_TARER|nr:hypothetical protein QVD17_36437 [Tagetes erecta]
MAKNRFVCEVCSKGFQRDQNLQLHKRGHNLPWKLKQRNKQQVVRKKVYICPEESCVHHDPSRALGDLTGVKKHFSRKHGEKKWKCEKCSKKYAVQSDCKAHSKICGTREYKCDCGTIFARKDSFITHRAFCDALTEDNSRIASFAMAATANLSFQNDLMMMNPEMKPRLPIWLQHHDNSSVVNMTTSSSFLGSTSLLHNGGMLSSEIELNPLYNTYGGCPNPSPPPPPQAPHMSATALLQKASQMGSTRSTNSSGFGLMNTSEVLSGFSSLNHRSEDLSGGVMLNDDGLMMMMAGLTRKSSEVDADDGNLTRDFLGVEGNERTTGVSLQHELMKFT